jgi:hypothetical protein
MYEIKQYVKIKVFYLRVTASLSCGGTDSRSCEFLYTIRGLTSTNKLSKLSILILK